jgi:hypothetical protein
MHDARPALSALLLLAFSLTAQSLACSGDLSSTLRKSTYPPSFEYITKEQLQSTMWQLARDANELDYLAEKPDPLAEADRARMLALLGSMSDAAKRLGAEGKRTNHPLLDENREQFRADLAAARRGVESEPPSYTLARSVSTACSHCHRPR